MRHPRPTDAQIAAVIAWQRNKRAVAAQCRELLDAKRSLGSAKAIASLVGLQTDQVASILYAEHTRDRPGRGGKVLHRQKLAMRKAEIIRDLERA